MNSITKPTTPSLVILSRLSRRYSHQRCHPLPKWALSSQNNHTKQRNFSSFSLKYHCTPHLELGHFHSRNAGPTNDHPISNIFPQYNTPSSCHQHTNNLTSSQRRHAHSSANSLISNLKYHAQLYFSKSSGPGGQNVNKVNTKAECKFHIASAWFLPSDAKQRLRQNNSNKVNRNDELIISSQMHREQNRNADEALKKLQSLVKEALVKPKKRIIREGRTEKGERERRKMKNYQKQKKDSRRGDWKKMV